MAARFHRIVCATDLGDAADAAIREADREARLFGAELLLLHVIPGTYPGAPMSADRLEAALMDRESLASGVTEALLDRLADLTGRGAEEVQVVIEDGRPDEAVLHGAARLGADLVVVGGSGVSGLRRLLLGRVADRLIRQAPMSVLVARPGPITKRIVVGTDFSAPSMPALTVAAEEARRRGARLTLVHSLDLLDPDLAVGEPGAPSASWLYALPVDEARASLRRHLERTLARLGVDGDPVVVEGPPARAIVRVAAETGADRVVVGTAGRAGIDRLLVGSVAEAVARTAPCSVLIAREPPGPELTTYPPEDDRADETAVPPA